MKKIVKRTKTKGIYKNKKSYKQNDNPKNPEVRQSNRNIGGKTIHTPNKCDDRNKKSIEQNAVPDQDREKKFHTTTKIENSTKIKTDNIINIETGDNLVNSRGTLGNGLPVVRGVSKPIVLKNNTLYPGINQLIKEMKGTILEVGAWPTFANWDFDISKLTMLTPRVDAQSTYEHIKNIDLLMDMRVIEFAEINTTLFEHIYMIDTIQELGMHEIHLLVKMAKNKFITVFQPDYSWSTLKNKTFSYTTKEDGDISMEKGCQEYNVRWKKTQWMYTQKSNDVMTWTKAGKIDDMDIFIFMERPNTVPIDEEMNTTNDIVMHSYLNNSWYFFDKAKRAIKVPATILNIATSRLNGKERNATTFKAYVTDIRTALKTNHLEMQSLDIINFSTYTFTKYMDFETQSIQKMLKGDSELFNHGLNSMVEHSEALNFKPKRFIPNKKMTIFVIVLLLTILILGLISTMTYNNIADNVNNGTNITLAREQMSAKLTHGLYWFYVLLSIIISVIIYYFNSHKDFKNLGFTAIMWHLERFLGRNYNVKINFKEETSILKNTCPLDLVGKSGEGNSITINELSEVERPSKDSYYKLVGPTIGKYLNYAYTSNHINSTLSMNNRNVAKNKFEPDMKLIQEFKTWVDDRLVDFLPHMYDEFQQPITIEPMATEDWIATFPPTKRNKLLQAWKKTHVDKYEWTKSVYSCFVKQEFYPIGTDDGTIDWKDPRNICSPDLRLVVLIAPFIKTFANKIKDNWHNNNAMFYSSGQNGLGVGKFF